MDLPAYTSLYIVSFASGDYWKPFLTSESSLIAYFQRARHILARMRQQQADRQRIALARRKQKQKQRGAHKHEKSKKDQ